MKLIWLTDIHLNFLKTENRMDFYQKIIATSSDVILLSGDIAEAPSIQPILKEMVDSIQRPIYFVLGNHDYYHGSVYSVRQEMTTLTKGKPRLFWLPGSGPQKLSKDVILLGQDCFADGRYGDISIAVLS